MVRLESSGGDCTMGSELRENGVNLAYTEHPITVPDFAATLIQVPCR